MQQAENVTGVCLPSYALLWVCSVPPTCLPPHLQNLQIHRLVSQSNKFYNENVFLSRLKPWLLFLDILLWSEATIATFRSPTQYPCPVDWWGRIFRREWRFSRNTSNIRIHHIVAIFISALIALLTGRAIFVVGKKSRKVVRAGEDRWQHCTTKKVNVTQLLPVELESCSLIALLSNFWKFEPETVRPSYKEWGNQNFLPWTAKKHSKIARHR